MDRKMDVKKFLMYYVPVVVIFLIVGYVFPDWVEKNYMLYCILLVSGAFIADMMSRRGPKK